MRHYGQHFLHDVSVVRRIVEESGIGKTDAVLEIGPGRGILTQVLAESAGRVLAVEIDRTLFSELKKKDLPSNVTLQLKNVLELSTVDLVRELGKDFHVVANLPYEITSEILQLFLPMRFSFEAGPTTLTLMMQKEVGERIVAKPGEMSRLALFCGYYSDARMLFSVPKGAFSPPPKVQSCVMKFTIRSKQLLPPPAEKHFFRLIETAFAQKRKTIANALAQLGITDLKKKLEEVGIHPQVRPQEISLEQWMTLALKM